MKSIWNTFSKYPIHPVLFATSSVLSLAAANRTQILLGDVIRTLLIVTLTSLILSITIYIFKKDALYLQILLSLAIILFLTYGHVYNLVRDVSVGSVLIGRHRYLLLLVALFLGVGFIILQHIQAYSNELTQPLNTIAVVLLAFPLYTLVRFEIVTSSRAQDTLIQPEIQLQVPTESDPPDIYYIILDSYAREDVLREIYGFDNQLFREALESIGFYVASESVANHSSTSLSLASSLNMEYIQNLDVNLPPRSYPQPLVQPIRENLVASSLQGLGYKTVATASGFYTTTIPNADVFLTPDIDTINASNPKIQIEINPFEEMYLRTTILRVPLDLLLKRQTSNAARLVEEWSGAPRQRELVLAAFDHLKKMDAIAGPKFVFVHIISPHRPYLFTATGEEILQTEAFTFEDTTPSEAIPDEFLRYRDQLLFINQEILESIDAILAASDREPIIILQADHGPAFGFNWDDPDQLNLQTKFPILNAYLLPDHCTSGLFPTISPVNTFRILFNCVFDADLPILEDQAYFTNHHSNDEYQFVPIELLLDN
jgi:hypothetical protein